MTFEREIFMLVCVITLPLFMIILGFIFCQGIPRKINMFFGYRTVMSMKNQNTWNFAHKYIGKLWCVIGYILLPLSIIIMFFCLELSENYISTFSLIVLIGQLIIIVIPIIFTERELKNRFDKNGDYK